jgi:uncharacterized damage-inducible protein DinB
MYAVYLQRLYDYNFWAHRRVWDCVMQLSDEQFTRPCDYSIGSVHQQVVHTMGAEWLWLSRLKGVSPDSFPAPEDYPTRTAIRTRWDEIENNWREYVGGLGNIQPSQMVTYVSINGRSERTTPLWEALIHILNHSTDHRAQTLALIHQVGGKTIEQDLIFYSWEKPFVTSSPN